MNISTIDQLIFYECGKCHAMLQEIQPNNILIQVAVIGSNKNGKDTLVYQSQHLVYSLTQADTYVRKIFREIMEGVI